MKFFRWIKDRLTHKLSHLSWDSIKKTFKEHGLALVVIIVAWEIIEDVGFPLLFIFLGNHVHPAFYAGAPAAWILCLHWLAVPLIWSAWIKIKKGDKEIEAHDCSKHD
tara:strand:- start:304 stop:627 length:324 start_codon:yes stop_codon:yes gene_type:complete